MREESSRGEAVDGLRVAPDIGGEDGHLGGTENERRMNEMIRSGRPTRKCNSLLSQEQRKTGSVARLAPGVILGGGGGWGASKGRFRYLRHRRDSLSILTEVFVGKTRALI